MMHDLVLAYIRKLKDSQNRPLYLDSFNAMQAGMPMTIYGYPNHINQSMDSTVTATKNVMAFGLFSKYKVRRVRTMRLIRLVERYRVEYDADAFLALIRMDGKTLGGSSSQFAAASRPIKLMTQHS
jgi:HK97 family phage major capsid protein